MHQTLYLMLGYPGAGKTTASKIIQELTGAEHIWADHERHKRFKKPSHSRKESIELYNDLNNLTDRLLNSGESVIFDTNFNFYKDRERLRRIANKNNAANVVIWVQTPKEIAKLRATHPNQAKRNTYVEAMPEQRFERISKDFEPPKIDERIVVLDGTKLTKNYVKKALGL